MIPPFNEDGFERQPFQANPAKPLTQHVIDNQPDIIRNFRMCTMKGCLEYGWHQPMIMISPDGVQAVYMNFNHMLYCDQHKKDLGLEDFVDGPLHDGGNGFERIQRAFRAQGKAVPEREFSKLLWRDG